ncbi:hypothetical protein QLX08_002024 [Tetragonisca angustula]|uniref:Uncharacterized protein n=1 Tax=Tetragonisca angustula TaxID=166442 RepID=A0AAW1ACQ2_9HYME
MVTSAFTYLLLRAPLFPILHGPRRERPVGPARAAARDEKVSLLIQRCAGPENRLGRRNWREELPRGSPGTKNKRIFCQNWLSREKNVPQ